MDEQEILQILDEIQRRVEKEQHDVKLLEDYFAAARMYAERTTRRDACRFSARVRFWAQKALGSAVTAAEATQLYDLDRAHVPVRGAGLVRQLLHRPGMEPAPGEAVLPAPAAGVACGGKRHPGPERRDAGTSLGCPCRRVLARAPCPSCS